MPDEVIELNPQIIGLERTGEETLSAELQDEKEAIHRQALERFAFAFDADEEDRDAAIDDQRFRNGEQWPDGFKEERDKAGLPCLTSNRLNTFIDQVIGDVRQNRPQIKVLPGTKESDPHVAEILNGKIREIENASFADVAYDSAVENSTGCGRGYFRVVNQYEDDDSFDQVLRIKRIPDPMSVTEDPAGTEVDGSDGMYKFITSMIPVKEYKFRWPDAAAVSFDDRSMDYSKYWMDVDMVRVAEYWYKQPGDKKTLYKYIDGTISEESNLVDMNGERMKIIAKRIVRPLKVYWCLMSGSEILEGPFEWSGKHIPIIPVYGKEIVVDGKIRRYGLIRWSKDESRIINFAKSTEAELLVKAPKTPYIGTKAMFNGFEAVWNTADRRNIGFLPYNPDPEAPGEKPERAEPIQMHSGVQQAMVNGIEGLKATTGIFDAGLGARSNETSGTAIQRRQEESDTATFAYVDNLSRAKAYLGTILLDLIPKFYEGYQNMSIHAEDDSVSWEEVNVPVLIDPASGEEISEQDAMLRGITPVLSVRNDIKSGKYTATVTTGPSYKTQRIEAAVNLRDTMGSIGPEQAGLIADLMVKNLDFPDADVAARRLAATVPPEIIAAGEGKQMMPMQPGMPGMPQPGILDQNGNPIQGQPMMPQPVMG